MKTAYIGGSFDPYHFGHSRLIKRVQKLGFHPIVVVNSNSFIKEYKGREPFMDEDDRAVRFMNMPGVTVDVVDKDKQKENILKFSPDVIVAGTDWMKPEILPQLGIDEQFLQENDIGMLFLPRTPGISSTQLREENEARNIDSNKQQE